MKKNRIGIIVAVVVVLLGGSALMVNSYNNSNLDNNDDDALVFTEFPTEYSAPIKSLIEPELLTTMLERMQSGGYTSIITDNESYTLGDTINILTHYKYSSEKTKTKLDGSISVTVPYNAQISINAKDDTNRHILCEFTFKEITYDDDNTTTNPTGEVYIKDYYSELPLTEYKPSVHSIGKYNTVCSGIDENGFIQTTITVSEDWEVGHHDVKFYITDKQVFGKGVYYPTNAIGTSFEIIPPLQTEP